MSIIQNIINSFTGKKDQQAMAYGYTVGGIFTGPTTTNYETYYKLYRSSTDLRRVIQEKQLSVGQGGRQIINKDGDVLEEGPDYDNINAIFNNTYIPTKQDWLNIKQRLVRDMDLTGNRYLFKLRNEAGQVIGLQVLDPRYLTVVADEFGNIYGFLYRVKGNVQSFEVKDVVWDKNDADPDNEIYGFGIMESLVLDIMADTEASRANYGLFKNNMIPAQMIILEPNISQTEAQQAIENMKQMFSGGANKHKAGIIKGVKEIKQIQVNHADMEYLELRKFTTDKICSAFGVPKVMLGLSEGVNYTNADMLYKEFIQNTVKPEESAIANMMTAVIMEQYPDYRIEFIDAHIDDQEQKIEMYAKAIDNGLMTIDEARLELGFTPFETTESQAPLIKHTIKLLEDAGADSIRLDLNE